MYAHIVYNNKLLTVKGTVIKNLETSQKQTRKTVSVHMYK